MDDTRAKGSLARGGGLIAPALTLVNLFAYAVTVAAARGLPEDDYGTLIALLGVLLVLAVPAIAMQAVVARATATGAATPGALLRRCLTVGAVGAVAAALASPVIAAFLHSSATGPLLVAVQLVPFAVLCGAMGVLQGSERFGALAVVITAQAIGRGAGLVPLAFSGSSNDVLLALDLGMLGAALVGVAFASVRGRGVSFSSRDVARASGGLLALLLLANLDVLLARNVLSGTESGRYAVGAVLAKAAFWLPQAVAVVVFPRLADPVAGRALLRRSALLVAGLGAFEVLGCVVLARPVLELTFGESYGSLSPYAWLWVVQGAALSLVQLLVYRAIAMRDRVTGVLIGLAAAVEAATVLILRPDRPVTIIAISAAVALTLTVTLFVRSGQTRVR